MNSPKLPPFGPPPPLSSELQPADEASAEPAAHEQAASAARQLGLRYQALIRATGSIVWTNSPEGEMRGAQPDWCAYTGQSPAQCQGYGWAQALHPDDAQPTIDAWQKAIQEQTMFAFEHRVRRHDGEYRWFAIRAVPVLDEAGRIQEWVGLHRDIEDAKRAERERIATEQQFRTMIEWMPQLAWWAKPDGYIDYYNPLWYQYTGTTPEDMQGWGWQSVHDPKLLPDVIQRWQRSIATGEPFEMEFPLRRHDGVFRWFLTRVNPMRDSLEQIVRWVGINTDIDDQKTALARLSETIESMSDAFTLVDRNWCIQVVNRNHERMSQKTRAQSLGRNLWEVFPEARDPALKYWTAYHQAMNERVEVHFVDYFPATQLWTEVDLYPSYDGIAVFWRDISERKRQEAQREELLASAQAARSLAESASRAKDEFLAMLGHELRNPLAPILTALQLMQLREETGAERERQVIERQVKHLVRLVDDLLDISRITRGTVELSRRHLDLADVVARAIELAGPLLDERRHTLSVASTRGLIVDGDADRLAQVIANLLTNAAKYTPAAGRITLVTQRDGDEISLAIRDNGIGIAPDLLPVVFDLFVQGTQGIDRAQGGLGLGLAIVRRLTALHGGRVTAASEGSGCGATFTLYLPAVLGDSSPSEEIPTRGSVARKVFEATRTYR